MGDNHLDSLAEVVGELGNWEEVGGHPDNQDIVRIRNKAGILDWVAEGMDHLGYNSHHEDQVVEVHVEDVLVDLQRMGVPVDHLVVHEGNVGILSMLACLATLFFAVAKAHFLAFVVLVTVRLPEAADLVAFDLKVVQLELEAWKHLLRLELQPLVEH